MKYKLTEAFKVGDEKIKRGIKSTVTNVDDTTGAISWDIEKTPAIDSVFKEFEDLRKYIKELDRNVEDEVISNISTQIVKLFNQYRTHIRKNYPDLYKKVASLRTNEISTSGGVGSYNTPKAFKKPKYKYKLKESDNKYGNYFQPNKVKKVLSVDVFTNRRGGFKNYLLVKYIPLSKPQTSQTEWTKIPFETEEEKNTITQYIKNQYV